MGELAERVVSDQRSPYYSNLVGRVDFTIGAEAVNAITVNVQLKTPRGKEIRRRAHIRFFLSDDANGDSITATAADGGIAAGTDGWVVSIVTGKLIQAVSEADGDIDLVITHTGVKTYYLIAMLPDGSLIASTAVTFA